MKNLLSCKTRRSRLWIPALGAVIAYGFFHNCALAPHVPCRTIEWTNLIMVFSIMIGVGGARDVVLKKFAYLNELSKQVSENSQKGLSNKFWIPFIGWCLVAGFAHNFICVSFWNFPPIDWAGLMSALSIMLTISGARDCGICAQTHKFHSPDELPFKIDGSSSQSEKEPSNL